MENYSSTPSRKSGNHSPWQQSTAVPCEKSSHRSEWLQDKYLGVKNNLENEALHPLQYAKHYQSNACDKDAPGQVSPLAKTTQRNMNKTKKGEVKTQEMFHPGLPTSQNTSICHGEDVKQMFGSPVKFKNKLFLHLDHLCCSEFWAPFYRTSVLVPG